ncbi:MAG: c-type cytochrome [Rhodobacterales bacterium]|nr:c-type cytochrome [Rhodobacterales bacterium]MDX5388746.1 c-type cytochrome [Rhodobacterales bacterium]MDX5488435.1 c-type cytochrome [Rhodobacterales bacterium]
MSKSLNLYSGLTLGSVAMLVAAYNFADRNITPMPDTGRVLGEAPASLDMGFMLSPAVASTMPSDGPMGIGRVALPEEVAAWDVDVRPDGQGLPVGSGNVSDGDDLFQDYCAVCHGVFAEGVDNWPKLAGGDGTLDHDDPLKTVGSYWPYLSTVWDYVHRSMPFGNAQSLTPDEVYAITAYILYSNDLVDDDFVLSNENFTEVTLPNVDGFFVDDRDTVELPVFSQEPCMENCKETVEITMRATVLDVTPDQTAAREAFQAEEAAEAAAEAAEAAEETAPATEDTAAAAPAETAAQTEAAAPASGGLDMELVAAGEKVFKKCAACHQVGEGAQNKTGPHLNDVMGRPLGGLEGFNYSKTMAEMGASGTVWTPETMAEFLTKPRDYVKGTKMSFAGLKKDDEIAAINEYLKSFSQ